MFKKVLSFLLIISVAIGTEAYGQEEDTLKTKKELPKTQFYGPTIGLGVGNFKFFGDVLDAKRGNALISNIGYDLHVKQKLNSFLTAKFYVLFGTLSANERSIDRNLNFKSNITTGGFSLIYNFDHILPETRSISPYVTLGIESIEFHSKTDLYDAYGNEYNYWSDGSIRNMAEDDPNADQSIVIQRDYIYETDLREMDYDGRGKYPERTFAMPVGAGVQMHVSKHIDFSIGATMHFAFSDLIDNVTGESQGERIGTQNGTSSNDRFLMSSFSISYNFLRHKKEEEEIEEFEEEIDYLAYDNEDEDADGVIDFIDECPGTPDGVEVDEKGCPLDKDNDFVPNYKDDELESREDVPVSPQGVELTDAMILEGYQRYMDSTGVFADIENRLIAAEKKSSKKHYKVQVGSFSEAIDVELVDKLLSIPDVEIKNFGDTLTLFAVGDYDNLPDALKRKIQLTKQGYDAAVVVTEEADGMLVSVGDDANNMVVENASDGMDEKAGTVFRVQLGAFSKRLPESEIKKLGNVIEIKGDDGLYKYLYNNAFETMQEAAVRKVDLAVDFGVKDAFIVAYNDGKRISLNDAGVSSAPKENISAVEKSYDKSNITFKVQVGMYKNQLPTEVLSKFIEVGSVEQKSVENGLTRYTIGSFESLEDAESKKKEIVEAGLGGAFVISLHGEELIPISKAKSILEGGE